MVYTGHQISTEHFDIISVKISVKHSGTFLPKMEKPIFRENLPFFFGEKPECLL